MRLKGFYVRPPSSNCRGDDGKIGEGEAIAEQSTERGLGLVNLDVEGMKPGNGGSNTGRREYRV